MAADGRYELWVNGTRVGRGPIRSEPANLLFDVFDLAPHLRAGTNVVAALTRHYGEPTLYWKPAQPLGRLGFGSFICEVEATVGGAEVVIGTDAGWRALPAPYRRTRLQTPGPPPTEEIDGRDLPIGWNDTGFDDSTWVQAVLVEPEGISITDARPPTDPFPLVGPNPLPALSERLIAPTAVVRGAAESLGPGEAVTFDLGELSNGHPILSIETDEGTELALTAGEDLDEDGMPVAAPRKWAMSYTARGDTGETIEAFEPVGARYISVRSRGGTARVDVRMRERAYPRPEGAYFTCNEPVLDEIWRTGARTLDLCSTDAFIDCPGREQRAWLGDAYIHTLVSFVTSPDVRLLLRNLELHQQSVRPDGFLRMVAAGDLTDTAITIPDYSLHWVRTVARTWQYTGDEEVPRRFLPTAELILAAFERHRSGNGLLAEVPGWTFIDWAQTERGSHTAALDALFVLALEDCASIADAVGSKLSAESARHAAQRTRAAFETYWDRERGVYVDAAGVDARPGRRISQHTNALAILSGCAPPERWTGMLDFVVDTDRLRRTRTPGDPEDRANHLHHQWLEPEGFDEERDVVEAQPFFSHFVHAAVARAGRTDLLLRLIERWIPLLERGNGCFEEYWDAAPGLGSRCHAWSATPTFDLSTHILGIEPNEPGYGSVRIEPRLGRLERAEGAVPTPRGWIRVAIARNGPGWVELPPSLSGTIRTGDRDVALGPGRTDINTIDA